MTWTTVQRSQVKLTFRQFFPCELNTRILMWLSVQIWWITIFLLFSKLLGDCLILGFPPCLPSIFLPRLFSHFVNLQIATVLLRNEQICAGDVQWEVQMNFHSWSANYLNSMEILKCIMYCDVASSNKHEVCTPQLNGRVMHCEAELKNAWRKRTSQGFCYEASEFRRIELLGPTLN